MLHCSGAKPQDVLVFPHPPPPEESNERHYDWRWISRRRRRRSRPVRSTTGSPTENDDQSNDLRNDCTNDPTNIETLRLHAPYYDNPTYLDSVICLITASHYVVSFSIGLDERTMLPSHALFDTGSGMKIVRRNAPTDGLETLLTKDAVLPTLGDTN